MIYALITSAFKGWANKSSLCKNNFCGRCGETHPSSHSAGKAPSQQRCRGRLPHHPHLASKGMWCWEDGWEESLAWRVPAGEGAQGVHHPFPLSLCPDMPCSVSCRAGAWCAPQQQVQGLGLGVWDLGGKVCALLTGKYDTAFNIASTSFLSAGAARRPGMRQAAGPVIPPRWPQHWACQSCKHTWPALH